LEINIGNAYGSFEIIGKKEGFENRMKQKDKNNLEIS